MDNENTVLIIDQDRFLLGLYANAFKNAGLGVQGVMTGEEGISVINTQTPNIIVMDIIFQDMNAIQFLSHLHSQEGFQKIPIILVSNYNTDSYDAIADDVGIYQRLTKFENTTDDILAHVLKVIYGD